MQCPALQALLVFSLCRDRFGVGSNQFAWAHSKQFWSRVQQPSFPTYLPFLWLFCQPLIVLPSAHINRPFSWYWPALVHFFSSSLCHVRQQRLPHKKFCFSCQEVTFFLFKNVFCPCDSSPTQWLRHCDPLGTLFTGRSYWVCERLSKQIKSNFIYIAHFIPRGNTKRVTEGNYVWWLRSCWVTWLWIRLKKSNQYINGSISIWLVH